jgi:hypothetical protein
MIKLNKEMCQENLEVLRIANEQWFNGWEWSITDHAKFVEALEFFEEIKIQQRNKLIKQGRL